MVPVGRGQSPADRVGDGNFPPEGPERVLASDVRSWIFIFSCPSPVRGCQPPKKSPVGVIIIKFYHLLRSSLFCSGPVMMEQFQMFWWKRYEKLSKFSILRFARNEKKKVDRCVAIVSILN